MCYNRLKGIIYNSGILCYSSLSLTISFLLLAYLTYIYSFTPLAFRYIVIVPKVSR
jgi:hypothetical protein